MISLFKSFGETLFSIIDSVVQFVKGLIDGLMTIFKMLPTITQLASAGFGYLPSVLTALATLTLTICIVYVVVGRNVGSGS